MKRRPLPDVPAWSVRGGPWPALLCVAAAFALIYSRSFLAAFFSAQEPGDFFPRLPDMTGAAFAAHAKTVLLCAWFTASLAAAGDLLLARMGARFDEPCERAAAAFGTGAGAAAGLFFVLAALQLLKAPLLLGLLAAAALLPAARLRGLRPARPDAPGPLDSACLALIALAFSVTLPYALLPETFHDALKYHLELPSAWLQHGGFFAAPGNVFSGVPEVPQLLYGWTLAADPMGVPAKLFHWSFLPWLIVLFTGMARRAKAPGAGLLAGAILCSSPVVLVESYRVSVGLEWAFFQLLAIHAFLCAADLADEAERRRALLLGGLFAGLAMSCKYPAWLLPAAFLPLAWERRFTAQELGLAAAPAALVLLPFIVKNVVLYGNPVYPYFHDRFAPGAAFMPNWSVMFAETRTWGPGGVADYLSHPWLFTAYPRDVGGSIGPVLLGLSPLFLFARVPRGARRLAAVAVLCWAPLSLVSRFPRYFIADLAPFAYLEALAVASLPDKRLRAALAAAALAAGGATWVVFASSHPRKVQWPVLLGAMSASEFLGHTRHEYPDPPYAAIEYLNRETPADAGVLVVGDPRTFYLRRRHLSVSESQKGWLERWVESSADPDALKAVFDRERVGWVLVNHGEMGRNRETLILSQEKLKLFNDFLARHMFKVFSAADPRDRWVEVYQIR